MFQLWECCGGVARWEKGRLLSCALSSCPCRPPRTGDGWGRWVNCKPSLNLKSRVSTVPQTQFHPLLVFSSTSLHQFASNARLAFWSQQCFMSPLTAVIRNRPLILFRFLKFTLLITCLACWICLYASVPVTAMVGCPLVYGYVYHPILVNLISREFP